MVLYQMNQKNMNQKNMLSSFVNGNSYKHTCIEIQGKYSHSHKVVVIINIS